MNGKALLLLFSFGIGIFSCGFFWRFFDDILNTYFISYVYNTHSPYWLVSDLMWNAIPFILMLVGVVILVYGALSVREVMS